MLWIPITIAAAFFQNLRSAVQRHLKSELTDLGAASVRFLYALPFALVWLAIISSLPESSLPAVSSTFAIWVIGGAIAQIIFTFLLMWLFSLSNFTVGTALSKTEVVQVILLEALLLHESVSGRGLIAILIAFVGVMVMTLGRNRLSLSALLLGLKQKATLVGLACGFAIGLASVLFRGAALSLGESGILMRSAFTLAIATTIQTTILLVWLGLFQPGQIRQTLIQWRSCTLVGFAGWAASIFWFMAFTLTHAAYVRALGQIELIFTFVVSIIFFREKVSRTEMFGVILLSGAIILLVLEKTP
ncbi:MAG: EamA family transporter [Arenicellales bacterium]